MLSTYFAWPEVWHSSTASKLKIVNHTEDPVTLAAIRHTAAQMDKVRERLGAPISPVSWYRCLALNEAVGGAANSQHMKGEAVDFICPDAGSPRDIVAKLVRKVEYDQLILEPSWVHISFSSTARSNRLETLIWVGRNKYVNYKGN